MRGLYVKLGLTVFAGAALGLFWGQATVAGITAAPIRTLTERPYGMQDNGVELAGYGPAYTVEGSATADDARIVAACDDCSDYDLGYRFAAARKVRDSGQCMDFSWSYQRGCLAWLREG